MLRSDFPFPLRRWPQRLLAFLLGEPFLGFLAIIACALTLFPMLFACSGRVNAAIDAAQWLIIGWFAFEYGLAFATAHDRAAFLRDIWRWLDLATILIPLASLLPSVSDALRSSPVLRLARLIRLVTLGVRASGVITRGEIQARSEAAAAGPVQVVRLAEPMAPAPVPASWAELLHWLRQRGRDWFHVANPSPTELVEIGAAAGLPAGFLEAHLVGTNYPHLAESSDCAAVFVWSPELDLSTGRVDRHAVLLVGWKHGLLSLSRRPTRLVGNASASVAAASPAAQPDTGFAVNMIAAELGRILRQNEVIVARFEQDLRALEDVPVRESRPDFFERTFRLKKELSAAQSDLWRLRSVLADLSEGRAKLPGMAEADRERFGRLSASAVYLYETVLNIREEALSVIELHLNVVSFDMNRVMRLLAVVSVLGLIPAVIGGLFGMNLVDNPWPFTLPQVAFVVCLGMVIGLYLFFVKGWLR